jgi:hypothetical protein
VPSNFLEAHDPTLLQRHSGHIPVIWAWTAQNLEANASCSKALGMIQSWYRSSDLPVPCGDTSGYCNARSCLDENFLKSIFEKVTGSLERSIRTMDLWNGHNLKAIDCMRPAKRNSFSVAARRSASTNGSSLGTNPRSGHPEAT